MVRLQTDRLYLSFLAEALFVRFIIRDAVCASQGVEGGGGVLASPPSPAPQLG